MRHQEKLIRIYAEIPAFTCKPGCTDCCGLVPFSRDEAARVPEREQIGCHCVHADKDIGRCTIYADRPFMCRLFGSAPAEPRLKCPHGCGPDKPLSSAKAKELTRRYTRILDAEGRGSSEINRLRNQISLSPHK